MVGIGDVPAGNTTLEYSSYDDEEFEDDMDEDPMVFDSIGSNDDEGSSPDSDGIIYKYRPDWPDTNNFWRAHHIDILREVKGWN